MVANKIKNIIKGIIGKCSNAANKEYLYIYLDRDSVCAGDDCEAHRGILKVKNIDDFARQLKKEYLPIVKGDVYWIGHRVNKQGPILFLLDVPLRKKNKFFKISEKFHLEDGMSIFMEYKY